MNKRNIILKEASILFIASVVILSSIAVSGYTNNLQDENEGYLNFSNFDGKGDIVWDNNMNYDELIPAILDIINGIDFGIADDFMFTEDTAVLDVSWIGGYQESNYQQGNFNWIIVFYYDQGDGNAPGTQIIVHNFYQSQCNPEVIEDTGYVIFYEFSVTLPEIHFFQANTKYWIAIFGFGEYPPMSGWAGHLSPILLHPFVYGSDFYGIPYWTDPDPSGDMCFQLLAAPLPDLECEGSLSWTDVKPESVVTGSFEVKNIGNTGSLLDWEITDSPDWGKWIFEPDEGEDLTPEDEAITVEVTVIAPDAQKGNFEGEVTITNVEDSSDFCIIDVSLSTPKNKPFVFNFPLLSWLFERFPNMFPILRYML